MKLFILRGIPGIGKTTYASDLEDVVVISTDDYFTDEKTGKMNFNPTKLDEAHTQCFRSTMLHLQFGDDVVIDNTNVRCWEMSPYILLGRAFEAEISIIRFVGDPEVAARRNTSGVPRGTILRMDRRMVRRLPSHWPKETIIRTDGAEDAAGITGEG